MFIYSNISCNDIILKKSTDSVAKKNAEDEYEDLKILL